MQKENRKAVRRKSSAIGASVATVGVALSSIVAGPLPTAFAATSSAALSAMSGLASCPGGPKGTLNLAEDEGGPFVNNYNPFTGSHTTDTMSYVYETLLQFDLADSSVVSPWLSSSYSWSDNGKTLVFQLRRGVKWSDGRPFTSADVVFTFDLLKKDPATNIKGIVF
jgi:peptide/nickel transport system substrate-binding protein